MRKYVLLGVIALVLLAIPMVAAAQVVTTVPLSGDLQTTDTIQVGGTGSITFGHSAMIVGGGPYAGSLPVNIYVASGLTWSVTASDNDGSGACPVTNTPPGLGQNHMKTGDSNGCMSLTDKVQVSNGGPYADIGGAAYWSGTGSGPHTDTTYFQQPQIENTDIGGAYHIVVALTLTVT